MLEKKLREMLTHIQEPASCGDEMNDEKKTCSHHEWRAAQQCLIHFMFIIFYERVTIYQSRAYSSCSTLKCFKLYIHAQSTNAAYHSTFIQCTQHNANEALFQHGIYFQHVCINDLYAKAKWVIFNALVFETSAVNIIGAEQECRVPQIV